VCGVGNVQTHAEGKGKIKIKSTVNRKQYNLILKDVLYIPTNKQNLLSLGQWDKAGGSYLGRQEKLMMNARHGKTVATGTKINNHLYRLDNFIIQPLATISKPNQNVSQFAFNATEPTQTWETWHKRFGHLDMSSIKMLLDKKLVTSLNIDLHSLKYDCETCVQVKQHVTPFPRAIVEVRTKPGEIIHMDLWSKYPVQSIYSNQYFHTLDDSTQRPNITFLKQKDEATQAIKDYAMYLKGQGLHPNTF